jgi:CheY-like chemotaxis protein
MQHTTHAEQPAASVLVVTASPEKREGLQRVLTDAGYQVRVAENNEEAWKQVQEFSPAFLLLDLTSEGANRDEVLARLRAQLAPGDEEVLTLEELERAHFISVLKRTHGVIEGPRGAARLLNLKPSTARFRMKKLGINRADYLKES